MASIEAMTGNEVAPLVPELLEEIGGTVHAKT
jgi:hypothetical protein